MFSEPSEARNEPECVAAGGTCMDQAACRGTALDNKCPTQGSDIKCCTGKTMHYIALLSSRALYISRLVRLDAPKLELAEALHKKDVLKLKLLIKLLS